MQTRVKIVWTVVLAAVLSGCTDVQEVPVKKEPKVWHSTQKSEFLDILAQDKYVSICNQQALYEKARDGNNTQVMTAMLVAYAKNLANGCIINASQKMIIDGRTVTTYGTYEQKVSEADIKLKLQANQSIEQILQPYVPEYQQFECLLKRYTLLKQDPNTPKDTLYRVRLNIERLKLMKPGNGQNYALVNIPEFVVRIIEGKKTAVAMAVVVGQVKTKTPIFSEDLSYITLNPQWSVPDSIARNEVIPALLRDSNYLKNNRMVMRPTYDLNSEKLSPSSVDLKAYKGGKGHVPFKFIEVPSNKNALGRVKFIFPNEHSVYMHDTQMKKFFKRKVRTFSHGCVRLSEPRVMLDYISKNYTSTSPEEVKKKYDSLKTHYVKVTKRLPVHTVYLTTYIDECKELLIFDDIYGFDKLQKLNF